jgi:hypothetical protein
MKFPAVPKFAQLKDHAIVHGPLTVNCAVCPLSPVWELLKVATVLADAGFANERVTNPESSRVAATTSGNRQEDFASCFI